MIGVTLPRLGDAIVPGQADQSRPSRLSTSASPQETTAAERARRRENASHGVAARTAHAAVAVPTLRVARRSLENQKIIAGTPACGPKTPTGGSSRNDAMRCALIRLRTREGMKIARAKGRLRSKQPKLNHHGSMTPTATASSLWSGRLGIPTGSPRRISTDHGTAVGAQRSAPSQERGRGHQGLCVAPPS